MGLFSRKRKPTIDTRPVPGRDDLVEVKGSDLSELVGLQLKIIDKSMDNAIASRVERMLAAGAAYILGRGDQARRGDPASLGFVNSVVRHGFVTRRTEVDKMDGALSADVHAPLLEAYNAIRDEVDESGHIYSVNSAYNLYRAPFNSKLEQSPDDPVMFPGFGVEGRKRLSHVYFGLLVATFEEIGDGHSVPDSVLADALWGYGYMIHVFSEINPDGWLVGADP